jgi:fructoselysine-6-P-deglycase FrlB-like protein
MPPHPSPDPLGHALLGQRLACIPELLLAMTRSPLEAVAEGTRSARHFVVTGTGSSEAHARYLVTLLNRHARRPAEFVPLSAFCDLPEEFGRGRVLIVVSQGLSPNAQVAIDRHRDFDHLVVFTSTTASGAAAAGKHDRAARIHELEAAGVEFVRSPLEEEYATLIRFVGPLAVYVRAHQFVRCLAPNALRPLLPDELGRLLATRAPADVVERFVAHTEDFRRGFYLLAGAPLCEFAQNLSYKFLEGLYWSAPVIWDFLQFAHGPFQEVTLQPRPVVILEGPGGTDCDLAIRTRRMLESARVPCIDLRATSAGPLAIFEYEALFNDLVMQLIRRLGIDQRNWPSKGKDDPLYGFFRVG